MPRRSCLTARNDDLPFYSHVSRHCEERSKPENPDSDKNIFLPQSSQRIFAKFAKKIIVFIVNQINHSSDKNVIVGLTRNPLIICKGFLTAFGMTALWTRHCGFDPQSPARLRSLQEIPASAGMTKWGNGMTTLIGLRLRSVPAAFRVVSGVELLDCHAARASRLAMTIYRFILTFHVIARYEAIQKIIVFISIT